jgi:2'-5' RNA ligase
VAKERLKSPRARLFVALDLPDEVRAAVEAWQASACGDPALRALAPAQLHVTLCFLGWQRERDIGAITKLITGIETRRISLRFEREPVSRPPRGRPRLFALRAESQDAVALQAELSARLQEGGYYKPEKRAFWPHVTVARVRNERRTDAAGKRRKGRPRLVESPPGDLPPGLERPFDAVRVSLYRSNLRPQGAEYASLATMELPPAAAER